MFDLATDLTLWFNWIGQFSNWDEPFAEMINKNAALLHDMKNKNAIKLSNANSLIWDEKK